MTPMGKNYDISGEVKVTAKAAYALPSMPIQVNLAPERIDSFAALMHVLFAHRKAPVPSSDRDRYLKHVTDYLRSVMSKHPVWKFDFGNRVQDGDSVWFEWGVTVTTLHTAPHTVVVRVNPTAPLRGCLKIMAPSGVFLQADLAKFTIGG